MRKFLRHELNRYLLGRAGERSKELPLLRVENQTYIHYAKGSLVMYALREYIGEERLNAALAAFIKRTAFQDAPFTTSRELLAELEKVTPSKYKYLLEDLFESITIYDNRASRAEARALGGGRYEVEIDIHAVKYKADEHGKESPVDLDDWVDVGVYTEDEDGEPVELYRDKHLLTQEETTVTVEVDQEPKRAGVDPFILLVDRDPDDNMRAVKLEG